MKKSGGLKGGLWLIAFVVCLCAAIMAWARINNIHSVVDGYDYFKAWSDKAHACAPTDFSLKCKGKITTGNYTTSGSTKTTSVGSTKTGATSGSKGSTTSTGTNTGTKSTSGSGSTTAPNKATPATGTGTSGVTAGSINTQSALAALNKLKIANPNTSISYNRADWKHWIGSPCDTRQQVLIAQGKNVSYTKTSSTCKINSGTWTSPYDGKVFTVSTDLDIDHMIPLDYAAQHGGQSWDASKKQAFANDLSQLMAVSANANRSKGDKGPADYMPQTSFQCTYSKVWISTATKYGVSITDKDKLALENGLKTC